MKLGDVVVVEGISSPRMKVVEIRDDGGIVACWFTTNSEFRFATFKPEMLFVLTE